MEAEVPLIVEVKCAFCGATVLRKETYLKQRQASIGDFKVFCKGSHQVRWQEQYGGTPGGKHPRERTLAVK